MSRGTLIALGAGILSALLVAVLLTGAPGAMLLLYIAQLPLFAVALSLGVSAGVIASATGGVIALLAGGLLLAAIYLLVFAAPALLVSRQALRARARADGGTDWYPPGLLLGWLAGAAAAMMIGTGLLFSAAEGGLEGQVRDSFGTTIERLMREPPPPEVAERLEQIAAFLPAMLAVAWLMMSALNAVAAQALLARFGRALRPSPRLVELGAPQWLLPALGAAVLAALVLPGELGFVGRNLVPVLAAPYFFVGLAVVHCLARRLPSPLFLLIPFYALLIFLGLVALVLVSALGLAESWLNLRKRFGGPRQV
ncbi:MAG: DUF2232 domain-containing protein [Alphaproteobacteria bacterium]